MSDSDSFPSLPSPSLSLDGVVQYLLALKSGGHNVCKDSEQGNVFYIVLGELTRIRISVREPSGTGQVQLIRGETATHYLDVSSFAHLEETIATFARQATGGTWPSAPASARLSADTPATNLRTISQLVGSSKVEAVFDPYLENCSLATLIDILSFGHGEVASGVRLLGSTRVTQGQVPRISKAGVDVWLEQLGIAGEARIMALPEHRRFLLLSGGRSLILGNSLNAIHKNEAIRLEPDSDDRAFFDDVWATATALA